MTQNKNISNGYRVALMVLKYNTNKPIHSKSCLVTPAKELSKLYGRRISINEIKELFYIKEH